MTDQNNASAMQEVAVTDYPNQSPRVIQAAAQAPDRFLGASTPMLQRMEAEARALQTAHTIAHSMSKSKAVLPEYQWDHRPSTGRGNNKSYGPALAEQAGINGAAAIMYGMSLGIGAIQSLKLVHTISGSCGIEARTAQALCERQGVRFEFDPNNDGQQATIGATRPDRKPVLSTWRMEDAELRGYTKNPLYQSHPDEMLRAKALMTCCRLIAPDVILGLDYSVEELQLENVIVERVTKPGGKGSVDELEQHLANQVTAAQNQPRAGTYTVGGETFDHTGQRVADDTVADDGQDAPDGDNQPDTQPDAGSPATGEPGPADDLPDDAVVPVELATEAMLKPMHVLLTEAGVNDRDEKLAILSCLTDRVLKTSKEMTVDEVSNAIGQLAQWKSDKSLRQQLSDIVGRDVGAKAPGDGPDPKATMEQLKELRAIYRDRKLGTGNAMLERLSNDLGYVVTNINDLTDTDVREALRKARGDG
jgi:hypothetical protein